MIVSVREYAWGKLIRVDFAYVGRMSEVLCEVAGELPKHFSGIYDLRLLPQDRQGDLAYEGVLRVEGDPLGTVYPVKDED